MLKNFCSVVCLWLLLAVPIGAQEPGVISASSVDTQPGKTTAKVYLIGNSLTWDTSPSKLDGNVQWHVDCGKPLTYIRDNPKAPCVKSSTLWPSALSSTQYDYVAVQPHYGTTIDEDVEVISQWVEQQPKAVFVIHTGWARHAQFVDEWADQSPAGKLTHSKAHNEELLRRLRTKYPDREFRCTEATKLLKLIASDIAEEKAPIKKLEDLYRDAIHMKLDTGRFLMHNAMRQSLGQPLLTQWPKIDSEMQAYLLKKLKQPR